MMFTKPVRLSAVLIIFIFFFILTVPQISSLGISPGRTTIDFEPGLEKTVTLTIMNTEDKEMDVVLYAKGELKDKIAFVKDTLHFSANDKEKTIAYGINLPGQISRPGLHTGEIVALEVPPGGMEEGAVIGATVAVVSQLYVYVPYPGKYIDYDLDILEKEGQVSFYVPVINRGEQNINKLGGSIKIYSGTKLVEELTLDSVSLDSGRREELIARWQEAVPGNYRAKLALNYDGEEAEMEKDFRVGGAKIEIISITVEDFSLGEIAKFNILVESKWKEEISDVSVEMLVYGSQGESIADFRTANYEVPAFQKVNMNSYWDTKGVKKDTYDGKLVLRYEDVEEERNIRIRVTESSIEILGLTGYVVEEGGGKLNLVNLLLILVGLLVIANIVWFVLVKKLKKKKKK